MAVLEDKAEDLDPAEAGQAILQDILGDQSFSLKEADLSSMNNLDDLLRMAVEFENDSILFYEMIGSLIDDKETSEKLQEIIKEEKYHIELLKDFENEEGEGKGD
jgi:rubrerythrin